MDLSLEENFGDQIGDQKRGALLACFFEALCSPLKTAREFAEGLTFSESATFDEFAPEPDQITPG